MYGHIVNIKQFIIQVMDVIVKDQLRSSLITNKLKVNTK